MAKVQIPAAGSRNWNDGSGKTRSMKRRISNDAEIAVDKWGHKKRPEPCINPGCEIPTYSETGVCALCTVLARAKVRVESGNVADLSEPRRICSSCRQPFEQTSAGQMVCDLCKSYTYNRDYEAARRYNRRKQKERRADGR